METKKKPETTNRSFRQIKAITIIAHSNKSVMANRNLLKEAITNER